VYLEREMYEDAQTFFRKTLQIGPNLIEAYFELGRALWFDGQKDEAMTAWRDGHRTNKFNPWGKRCGEMLKHVEGGGSLSRSRATA
jgi:tetratricopeptide (TPR) repeat protein